MENEERRKKGEHRVVSELKLLQPALVQNMK